MSTEWIDPNEGWADKDAPTGRDMRRIESNTDFLHRTLANEAAARLAGDNAEATARDLAISNAVTAEANARSAADQAEATARSNADAAEANARSSADNSVLSGHPSFYVENRSSDPTSPPVGHLWLRVDL